MLKNLQNRGGLLAVIFVGNMACQSIGFVGGTPVASPPPAMVTPELQVVIAMEGVFCDWGQTPATPGDKCPDNFKKRGVFEANLLGSNTNVGGQYGFDLEAVDDVVAEALQFPGYGPLVIEALSGGDVNAARRVSPLGYRRLSFRNLEEWTAFKASTPQNTVIIEIMSPEVENHWSTYAMISTLGLLPGYSELRPAINATYYDVRGNKKTLTPQSELYINRWTHITFFFWGTIQYHVGARNPMYEALSLDLQQLIQEAASR